MRWAHSAVFGIQTRQFGGDLEFKLQFLLPVVVRYDSAATHYYLQHTSFGYAVETNDWCYTVSENQDHL